MSEAGGERIFFVSLSSSSSGSGPPSACVGPSRLVPDTGRLRDIGLASGQEDAGEWGGEANSRRLKGHLVEGLCDGSFARRTMLLNVMRAESLDGYIKGEI
jgi:hypothetical protein